MYTITEKNIDFILEDLRRRGIATESLRLNLLDHICIMMEENLDENGGFEQFYDFTIKKFYEDELCELEEETMYLTYKNKFIMKKAMIISGIFSAATFISGSLGKILLLRVTNFLTFLGFTSFVLLFLPLVFIVTMKEVKFKNDVVMFASGILSGMIYFICMLVKCLGLSILNHGNSWLILWLTGLAIGSFIFIPTYFLAGIRKQETKTTTIIISIFLVAFIGVQFRLTNLKPLRSTDPSADTRHQTPTEKTNQLASYTDK
jgi:hypothetical protein